MQVSTRIVVPAAISGIIASFVLAISRAVGETMIVLIAAGRPAEPDAQPDGSRADDDRVHRGDRPAATSPTGSIEYKTIFAVGATLFVMTFVMNIISIRLVRRYREIYE